jgi:hypothetical protein
MNPQDPSQPYEQPPVAQYRVVLPPPKLPQQLYQVPLDPEPPKRKRWPLIAALSAAALLVAGLCTWLILTNTGPHPDAVATSGGVPSAAEEADTWSVRIEFELADPDTAYSGCIGQGGYSDIGPGTPVTLKDETGTIIASNALTTGTDVGIGCQWLIFMEDVPTDREFYVAEIGDRGEISYSRDRLVDESFVMRLYLGE